MRFGTKDESRIWNALFSRYHNLGKGLLCGDQIRYLARRPTLGYVGGAAFSLASWKVAVRDVWIGWGEEGRQKNLGKVVNNSRFLIWPPAQVPPLALHLLGRLLRRMPGDWERLYGGRPDGGSGAPGPVRRRSRRSCPTSLSRHPEGAPGRGGGVGPLPASPPPGCRRSSSGWNWEMPTLWSGAERWPGTSLSDPRPPSRTPAEEPGPRRRRRTIFDHERATVEIFSRRTRWQRSNGSRCTLSSCASSTRPN